MSQNAYVNAVYGVVLKGNALRYLKVSVAAALEQLTTDDEDFEDQPEDDRVDAALRFVEDYDPAALVEVRQLAGLPADVNFHWTAEPDAHPGDSQTDPETWLAGYGLYDFPEKAGRAKKLGRKASWHTWVTMDY